MDKRVEIHGTSRADMNGKRGVATDVHYDKRQDKSKARYTVHLDSGEAFKLKRANLRAEGTGGGASSSDGKAKRKGKGKKGRGGRTLRGAGGLDCEEDELTKKPRKPTETIV